MLSYIWYMSFESPIMRFEKLVANKINLFMKTRADVIGTNL